MTEPPPSAWRRTKIIATIGPASIDRVADLARAGMDVARLNLSHGSSDWHDRAARAVRDAEATVGRPIGLLVDLPGPKIRLGELAGGEVRLLPGDGFMLRRGDGATGDASGVAVPDDGFGEDLRRGDRILLADGAVELRVMTVGRVVETEVVRGGIVRSRSGVAIPAERLRGEALTDADRALLPRLGDLDADLVAQSYVRGADDVRELRAALGPDGPPIVAKIETRPAVEAFEAILSVADGVMIARGDLGVELPFEDVPIVQKHLVRRALDRGVPAIVATQMLESMTNAPRPTRAEASDVANAVLDGADAVLLSAETAIGGFPLLACEAAERIVRAAEGQGRSLLPRPVDPEPGDSAGALAVAAASLAAAHPEVRAIACLTRTGRTARLLAARRPMVPIVGFSPDAGVTRALALVHGVVARPVPPAATADLEEGDRLALLTRLIDAADLVPTGSTVVVVASSGPPGSAPDQLALRRVGS